MNKLFVVVVAYQGFIKITGENKNKGQFFNLELSLSSGVKGTVIELSLSRFRRVLITALL